MTDVYREMPADSGFEVRTIDELVGKTFGSVTRHKGADGDVLSFARDDGRAYSFYHGQDCCEVVEITDICGDLSDLEGVPILQAEERVKEDRDDVCQTWTFYSFTTSKGTVVVRWHGSSNGYYSETESRRHPGMVNIVTEQYLAGLPKEERAAYFGEWARFVARF